MKAAFKCRCPKCGKGALFQKGLFNLKINENCSSCNIPLSKNDCGDGPAVFLIFILGFLLVPLAAYVEFIIGIPLWAHAILWGIVALGITVFSLKPIKAYIMLLQFKHRPGDWK
jgi:uncharacterized protein (DUF983 family)